MKVAIVGSRGLNSDIPESAVPKNTTQIISGGARGMDRKAREYALSHRIQIFEIVPDYDLYGKKAPIIRNDIIIRMADLVLAFWDGESRGTKYVINRCRELDKPLRVFNIKKSEDKADLP